MHRLRAVVVGLSGIGVKHARTLLQSEEYALVGACDLSQDAQLRFLEEFSGVRVFGDYEEMLLSLRPDVVVVATPTSTHAELTIQAAQLGVKGVLCEKPMATNLGDGRKMLEACARAGAYLVVNHQRRLLPEIGRMREMLMDSAIGDLELVRGSCAGDFLSDGTHLVDTIRYLLGDIPYRWVMGQVHIEPKSTGLVGWRYGHPVEDGAFAVVDFEGGVRVELLTGTMQPRGQRYQHYEVIGNRGRLRRPGDGQPLEVMADGQWHQVSTTGSNWDVWRENYRLFARAVISGESHPLGGESALQDLEIVMAVYESARTHRIVRPPITQARFPLELMIEGGV